MIMITPAHIRKQLELTIAEMANNVARFVNHPGRDFTRKRQCTFENTVRNIISMESHSLNRELFEYYQTTQEQCPTKSAFVQSRSKLTPEVFPNLLARFNERIPFAKTFYGLHLIGCDGTDSNIPADAEDTDSFISYNSRQGGYYQDHTVVMYDLLEKRYTDAIIQPRGLMNEMQAFCIMVDRNPVKGKSLFIADRGFFSFNALAHVCEHGDSFLIRVKNIDSSKSPFKFCDNSSDEFDTDIEMVLSRKRTAEMRSHPEKYKYIRPDRAFDYIDPDDKSSSYSLSYRLVKIKTSENSFEYLVTNLPRNRFKLAHLKKLYHLRWKIETSFLFLKYGMAMNYFHSRRRDFIAQEVFAKLLLSNFISLIVSCTVHSKGNTIYSYHFSFSDAIYICRSYFLKNVSDEEILQLIMKHKVPARPKETRERKMRSQVLNSFQHRT